MQNNTKVGQTISRLAVVAKDFSTYYIPGSTMIVDKRILQIEEVPEEFLLLDKDGTTIGKVSKKTPYIVDYSDVYEVELPSEDMDIWFVQFGQYLLSEERRERFKANPQEGVSLEMRLSEVHHADLENWKESIFNNH